MSFSKQNEPGSVNPCLSYSMDTFVLTNTGLVQAISQLRKFKECFKVYGYCLDVLSPRHI
jgi:hypothetical protein